MSVDSQAQQQYLATFAALLKQQQGNSEAVGLHPEALPLSAGEFSQHLQVVPFQGTFTLKGHATNK